MIRFFSNLWILSRQLTLRAFWWFNARCTTPFPVALTGLLSPWQILILGCLTILAALSLQHQTPWKQQVSLVGFSSFFASQSNIFVLQIWIVEFHHRLLEPAGHSVLVGILIPTLALFHADPLFLEEETWLVLCLGGLKQDNVRSSLPQPLNLPLPRLLLLPHNSRAKLIAVSLTNRYCSFNIFSHTNYYPTNWFHAGSFVQPNFPTKYLVLSIFIPEFYCFPIFWSSGVVDLRPHWLVLTELHHCSFLCQKIVDWFFVAFVLVFLVCSSDNCSIHSLLSVCVFVSANVAPDSLSVAVVPTIIGSVLAAILIVLLILLLIPATRRRFYYCCERKQVITSLHTPVPLPRRAGFLETALTGRAVVVPRASICFGSHSPLWVWNKCIIPQTEKIHDWQL